MTHDGQSDDVLEFLIVPNSFQCVAKDVGVAVGSKEFRNDGVSDCSYEKNSCTDDGIIGSSLRCRDD